MWEKCRYRAYGWHKKILHANLSTVIHRFSPNNVRVTCDKCGREHLTRHDTPACPGHITNGERKGEPCTQPLGHGTDHAGVGCCSNHGGSTPNHVKNAQVQVLEREVQVMLGSGYDPITDPYTQLADLAGKIVRTQEFLQEKVEALDDLRSYGGQQGEQIDVIFAAFERALDRCERTLVNMARLDLDDRIAKLHNRINEDAVTKILGALTGALDAAEIKGESREVIVREFANRLRDDSRAGSGQTGAR